MSSRIFSVEKLSLRRIPFLNESLDSPLVFARRQLLYDDYAGIDYGILWQSMTVDVPALLPIIKNLVEALPPSVSSSKVEEFL